MRYPVETFTAAEQQLLSPHFTNLDRPVFALTTCRRRSRARCSPATRATRARCAASTSTSSPPTRPSGGRPFDGEEGERAAQLYERIFIGYGDDSVAQLGGAHLACEWVSNVLTKILQRGRLAAYLEQSTRYIPYDAPMDRRRATAPGSWRYCRDDELGPEFVAAMDEIFSIYSRTLERVQRLGRASAGRAATSPRRAWRALDQGQGARPAARPAARRRPSPTSASTPPARPTSSCCCGCSSSPLPEARDFGAMALDRAAAR